MTSRKQRVAIISLDGLSVGQFELLLTQMPALSSLLTDSHVLELDAAPFSDAQPIWAEILTGQHWYRNGCIGYATPLRSLNELRIFSESDLHVQPSLLPVVAEGQYNVVVNVPLLESGTEQRKWLADASSPTLTTVSPSSLLLKEPFKSYKPRPIISMGAAMADSSAISAFISAELNRLECALALCKGTDWKLYLYRASIFDQLAHLLGSTFLNDNQLKVSARIKDLLATLDSVLFEIISAADNYVLLSAFSHVDCKEMFSLNDFFQSVQLLRRTEESSKEINLRKQAFALAKGSNSPLVSQGSQLSPTQTVCASPIRGAVYVNSATRFADGVINEENLQLHEDRIANLLSTELSKFSCTSSLIRNPESKLHAPNFIVNMTGIDLVDSLSTIRRDYDLPHSVHDSRGFIWSKASSPKPVKSVEIIELISGLS